MAPLAQARALMPKGTGVALPAVPAVTPPVAPPVPVVVTAAVPTAVPVVVVVVVVASATALGGGEQVFCSAGDGKEVMMRIIGKQMIKA